MNKDNKNIPEPEGFKSLVPMCIALPHHEALSSTLEKIKKLDFHKAGGLKEDVPLSKTHYRVIAVEYLIRISKDNNCGMCEFQGSIFLYNGEYWKKIDEKSFKTFLGISATKMGITWDKAKDYMFKDTLYKQFISAASGFYLTNNQYEGSKINLKNGTYQISVDRSELACFNSDDFMRYQLPFYYDLNATSPLFDQFLTQVLPDQASQFVLAEFIASALMKSNQLKLEKALLLYGKGSNGKSVIFEIISALLGRENISNFSLGSLTNDNGYSRAELAGKILNYASEIHGEMKSDVFKQLVSGEPVEVRSPYGKPYFLTDYPKLMFNCNELPDKVEHSHAFFRRFIIIPFMTTIPEDKQDKELSTKIIANELPGIFNWILLGSERLIENKGYTLCEASNEKVSAYKQQSNSVLLFMDDCGYVSSTTNRIKLKELYSDYKSYCSENGYVAINYVKFSATLKSAGFLVQRIAAGRLIYAVRKVSNVLASMA